MARALVAPGRRGVARRARRRGDGHRRRDVPGDPHEPGLPEPVGAAVARRRRGAARRWRSSEGELRLGATVTHREVERDERVRDGWPCSRARSPSWPARGCATRRPSAASWPTPTTPRIPPRSSRRSAPGPCCARPPASGGRGHRGADPRLLRDLHPRPTSCSSRCVFRPSRARRSTGSSVRARRRIGRASPSRPSGTPGATRRHRRRRRASAGVRRRVRVVEGRAIDAALAAEVGARLCRAVEPIDDARGSAAYRRRVDRASRCAGQSRSWPRERPHRHRRPRDRRAAVLDRRGAARDAARRLRPLASRARARACGRRLRVARRLRRADARGRRRPRPLRLPGARPARARRRRAVRR